MASRDLRIVNMAEGQKIESDKVLKRIGEISYRDIGILAKIGLFDTGKALITSGLRVVSGGGMVVNIPMGTMLQRIPSGDILPIIANADQTVTMDAASGVARTDIIECQVKNVVDKNDVSQSVLDPTTGIISLESIKRDVKYYLQVQKKTGTTTATAATAGVLTGTVGIPGTIDLSANYLLNISDGEDGSFQEIDLRGATPEATTGAEIVSKINSAIGRTMASIGGGNVINLTGSGTGQTSYFEIKPPVSNSDADALQVVFGVSNAGAYNYIYQGVNDWVKLCEIDIGAATTVITASMIRNIDLKETWASDGSNILVQDLIYKQGIDEDTGWIPVNETWTYSSADSPTFLATVAGDKRTKYSKGMKLKLQQEQALTGYWTFNSDATSQVGSFTPTPIGSPTYSAGKFGNALTLNGTNQAISLADNALLKPTGDFTIGCWIKTSSTGVVRGLFTSYYDANAGANNYGFHVSIDTDNKIKLFNFTGGATTSFLKSSITVNDGNWHYVVVTFKRNWGQIYIDGALSASGYLETPVYYSTNYIRIGNIWSLGSELYFFNGQIDDLFLINGYALDEETIRAKYEANTAQGTGNITVTKKFILTDISYSSPNTTLTMYGGTDFALSNGAISNPFYSMVEQPFGFNRNPDKWSVILFDSITRAQASPVTGTWYNLGSLSISVPIGEWRLKLLFHVSVIGSGQLDSSVGLSTSSSSVSDQRMLVSMNANVKDSNISETEYTIITKSKTIFYLIAAIVATAGTNTSIILANSLTNLRIKATSIYL